MNGQVVLGRIWINFFRWFSSTEFVHEVLSPDFFTHKARGLLHVTVVIFYVHFPLHGFWQGFLLV